VNLLPTETREGFFVPKNLPDSDGEGSGDFQEIVNGFLNAPGLPFSNVLTAERIRNVFARHGGLFGEHGIYSTVVVLWAFLSQVLREGKEAACQSAVAQITAHCIQTVIDPPTKDTGDYCKGRAKLPEAALHELTCEVAAETEQQANEEWRWMKRHTKLVDGFTFTMPATEENLAAFPHPRTQKKGVGLPIARAVAILSLSTATVLDAAIGPYKGKETGESSSGSCSM